MSAELINAAAVGDLEKIKQLLSNPKEDINHYVVTENKGKYPPFIGENPLIAAIENQHLEIVIYLIKNGAKLDWSENSRQLGTPSALFLASKLTKCDFKLYRYLLRHSPKLNYYYPEDPYSTYANNVSTENLLWRHSLTERYKLFTHEAMLRYDIPTLDQITQFKYEMKYPTLESIKAYIGQDYLTPQELIAAKKGVAYCVAKNGISYSYEPAIQQFLESRCPFGEMPSEEKSILMTSPTRSLKELFAELQYWLYPEKKLPPVCVATVAYHAMDKSEYKNEMMQDQDRDNEIQFLQDPIQLRTFLALDQTEILRRLLVSTNTSHDNPAPLLLATILLHKSNEKIIVNHKEEPLLSEEQQAICAQVLKKCYSLTEMEKLLLLEQKTQRLVVNDLQQENERLAEQVNHLGVQVTALTNLVKSFERRLDANENCNNFKNDPRPVFFK